MRQIAFNLIRGVAITITCHLGKQGLSDILTQKSCWNKTAFILIQDETDTNKHLRPSMLHNQSESWRPRAIQPDRLQREVSEHSVSRDKQIAINTFDGCSLKCVTAHYHKVGPRNIFKGFKEQAIIVIKNEKD